MVQMTPLAASPRQHKCMISPISATAQAVMIRRYIIWRNNHAYDERLRRIVDRANVA
jgi:hypothetical protein